MQRSKFMQFTCSIAVFILGLGSASDAKTWESVSSGAPGGAVKLGHGFIRGETFVEKEVVFEKVNGFAIFEGDIILGTVEEVENAQGSDDPDIIAQGVVISGESRRWPHSLVPYQVDASLPAATQQAIADAMAHWEARTSIRFVERTAAEQLLYPDYVHFTAGTGCAAHVGRRGGEQLIWLAPGCTTGNTIHEIGHALGVWHEQSREDRDAFVQINWQNIQPGFEHNFNQHITDGDDIGPYDYGSIMHYGRFAFSRNNLPTIEPLTPNVTIGQRTGLSPGDIATINALYPQVDVQLSTTGLFREPSIDGYRLDWCRQWASGCGQSAARAFCRLRGYTRATSWAIDSNIGAATPTQVIATGQICDQAFCDGFQFIRCHQPAQAVFVRPTINSYRLDWCRQWGTECGAPAAEAFCRAADYAGVTSWGIDGNIGAESPTQVISTGQVCDRSSCDGFAFILCHR
jgi:astacin